MNTVSYKKNSFVSNHINKDIWYWNNVVNNSKKIIEFIEKIDSYQPSYLKISKWSPWVASNDSSVVYGSVKQIYPQNINLDCGDKACNDFCSYIINSFAQAFHYCFSLYLDKHNLEKNKYSIDLNWLNLKRWDAGSSMGPHFDGELGKSNGLEFTAILYLNDDYEGGELYFKDYNINLKPEAGSMVIFPGSFTHEVKEIKNSKRYMLSISAYKIN